MSAKDRQILRTPDSRFENLADWPYLPHYLDDLPSFPGVRIHYVDEKNIVTSGPLWGHIRTATAAESLIRGWHPRTPFIKSQERLRFIYAFMENQHDVTLVIQDWGGLIGLTLPMDMPERFERLLVMNTSFAPGTGKLSEGFIAWREFCKNTPDLDVGLLISKDVPHLSKEEVAAYNAPFPDASYKAGVHIFPSLVPDRPDAPGAELHRRAMQWFNKQHMPVFAAIGLKDRVIGRPGMVKTIAQFGGGCHILELEQAGHFVQEWGKEVAKRALKAFDLESQKIRKADTTIAQREMKSQMSKL